MDVSNIIGCIAADSFSEGCILNTPGSQHAQQGLTGLMSSEAKVEVSTDLLP